MKVSNTIEAPRLNEEMKEIKKTVSEFKKLWTNLKLKTKESPLRNNQQK